MSKPKILILTTGGGLTSKQTEYGILPQPVEKDDFIREIPQLSNFGNYDVLEVFREDSENLHPDDWIVLANKIHEHFEEYVGFVVLTGADAHSFIASALSFLIQQSSKPIVLTASTASIFSTEYLEGKQAVINAFRVACFAQARGVLVVVGEEIFLGTRVRKSNDTTGMHTSDVLGNCGRVGKTITFTDKFPVTEKTCLFNPTLETDIVVWYVYPGMRTETLFQQFLVHKPKAVIFVAHGTGCLPIRGKASIESFIQECADRGIPMITASRSACGSVQIHRFHVGKKLQELGVISAHDMSVEATITKTMWLLAQGKYGNDFVENFHDNICGEITCG